MLHRMAGYIAQWSVSRCGHSEKTLIFQYGIELLIDTSVKYLLFLLFGCLFGKSAEVVLVLVVFSGIRASAGGIHARTSIGCSAIMAIILFLCIKANDFSEVSYKLILICFVIGGFVIYYLAPNGNKANIFLSRKELEHKKVQAIVMLGFCCVLAFIWEKMRNLILTAILSEILTIIAAEVRKNE